ncbi:MAG: hypothetical protein WDZ52_04405 [Pseudohongiellaceae bacterium]
MKKMIVSKGTAAAGITTTQALLLIDKAIGDGQDQLSLGSQA